MPVHADPAHDRPPTDGLLESIDAHSRDLRDHAWSAAGAAVAMTVGLALIASLPCPWPPPMAPGTWPQCAGSVVLDLIRMDPSPVRGMAFWLGALFVAMLLVAVLLRPSASSSSANREAVRGALVRWTRALGLLSLSCTVWWVVMTSAQVIDAGVISASPAHLGSTSHPVELLAGLLLVPFFASTTALLQPGLGLTTRNIRWARVSLQRIDDWEVRRLPRLKVRADTGAAASHLFLVLVVTATHSQWGPDTLDAGGLSLLTAACAIAFLWLVLVGARNGFHGVDARVERWSATALGAYLATLLILVLAQLIPLWAAILWAAAWMWATTATVSAIALHRYTSPSLWCFSLQSIHDRRRRRYEGVIEENLQVLERVLD